MRQKIDFGIDLGTTNSAIVYMQDGEALIIKADDSQMDTTPSCIIFRKNKSIELGLKAKVISTDLYDEVSVAVKEMFDELEDNTVVLAAGEPRLKVTGNSGSGGRNLYMALKASELSNFDKGEIFVSLASDGMDNSPSAGAFLDEQTILKIKDSNINIKEHLKNFDAYTVFEKTEDLIMTGPTDANVSDLIILFKKDE